MKYTAQFKNIKNVLYQIDFDVNNDISGESELLLSDEPFTTETNSDELFSPLKLTNATCTILTNSVLTELFSKKVHDVKVTLKNMSNNKIEFVGYTTANAYTQPYTNDIETLQIELIDSISSLEYINYQPVTYDKLTYLSFLDFIIDAVKKTNSISSIYINDNIELSGVTIYNNAAEKLYIHEKNFINIDDDNLNYKEILRMMMEYLNFSLIQRGDEIFIIDYQCVKNNINDYTKYSTTDNWNSYSTMSELLSHQKTINGDDFMSNSTNLTLTETYNKASVEVENKIVTDLIPEIFDDELLKNITFESGSNDSYYEYTDTGEGVKYIIRFVRNEKIKDIHYYYSSAGNGSYTEIPQLEFYDSVKLKSGDYFGGTLRQIANYKVNEIPSKLNFENYIALKRWYSNQISSQNQPRLKMFEYVSNEDVALLYDDYYFMINFDVNFDDNWNSYFPYENDTPANANQNEALANGLKIPCKLQIGNKYWNGTNWTITDSFFLVNVDLEGSKKLFYKWYSVENQAVYTDEIDGEGQKILINKNDGLVGNPIFSIWTPTFSAQTYSIFYGTIWMKNFDFKLTKKDNLLGVRKENTDTIYENIIDDEYVNKFSTISAELNTDVNKGLCFTSVLYKDDNQIFNLLGDVLTQTNSAKKLELNKIENIVEQYSTPKSKIELTLTNSFYCYSIINFLGSSYLIDSYSIDYKNDSMSITMISY